MKKADDLLKGTQIADKIVKKFIAENKKRNNTIKEMISNLDYIEWLKEFTQDKDGFCDDDWLYFPEKISDSDRIKAENLGLFYDGIDRYASQNHIYPISCEFGNLYNIKLDDSAFEIGILVGQGTVFFCNKVDVEDGKEFIDFKDIMSGKRQDKVDQINETLDYISNAILEAYENGVPLEALEETIDNTIISIKERPKEYVKTNKKDL